MPVPYIRNAVPCRMSQSARWILGDDLQTVSRGKGEELDGAIDEHDQNSGVDSQLEIAWVAIVPFERVGAGHHHRVQCKDAHFFAISITFICAMRSFCNLKASNWSDPISFLHAVQRVGLSKLPELIQSFRVKLLAPHSKRKRITPTRKYNLVVVKRRVGGELRMPLYLAAHVI